MAGRGVRGVDAFRDSLLATAQTAARRNARRITLVRWLCALAGLVAAVLGAAYTYGETSHWEPALFAFLIILFTVGGGIPNVITERDRGRRAAYYVLLAVGATAVLYLGFRWSGEWWLASLLAIGAWVGMGGLTATVLFPGSPGRDHR